VVKGAGLGRKHSGWGRVRRLQVRAGTGKISQISAKVGRVQNLLVRGRSGQKFQIAQGSTSEAVKLEKLAKRTHTEKNVETYDK